jgi:glycine betaine/proline transport system substrate-binding protein
MRLRMYLAHLIRRFLPILVVGLTAYAPQAQEETIAAPQVGPDGEIVAAPEVPPAPPPCGTQPLTMARMQWPTSSLLTEIHARILTERYGCNVVIQEADMATAGSSMGSTGQPGVAPEMWISRIAEIWNAGIESQEVRQGGSSYVENVFEGWFVPDYAVAAFPEITTIEGLKARALEMGGGVPPKFISCPLDWGCNIVNRNLLRANGLDQLFQVIEPANRFELDTLIAESVGRQEPILFYYWQPNAILSQFAFREVQLGAYNKDNFICMGRIACATPMPTGFAPDPVIVAVSEWVYTDAPEVALYFQRAKMPFAEMNAMLQQLSETGATVETVAARFIAERGAVWKPWAGLEVAPEDLAAPRPQGVQPAPAAPVQAPTLETQPEASPPPDTRNDEIVREEPRRRRVEPEREFEREFEPERPVELPATPPPSLT